MSKKSNGMFYIVDEHLDDMELLASSIEQYTEMESGIPDFLENNKIKYKIARHLNNIASSIRAIAEKIDLHIGSNSLPVDPANGERKEKWKNRVLVSIILVIMIVAFCGMYYTISTLRTVENCTDLDVWSSSSSFWGALIGAIIAGMATIGTTYLIVHKNDKIDYHRERMSVLPVFSFNYIENNIQLKKKINKIKKSVSECDIFDIVDKYEKNTFICMFENIGYGIALDVKRPDREDCTIDSELGDFEVGRKKYCIYNIDNDGEFSISFSDLYGNKYIQLFKLRIYNDNILISTMSPELVIRTNRARYQQ